MAGPIPRVATGAVTIAAIPVVSVPIVLLILAIGGAVQGFTALIGLVIGGPFAILAMLVAYRAWVGRPLRTVTMLFYSAVGLYATVSLFGNPGGSEATGSERVAWSASTAVVALTAWAAVLCVGADSMRNRADAPLPPASR